MFNLLLEAAANLFRGSKKFSYSKIRRFEYPGVKGHPELEAPLEEE